MEIGRVRPRGDRRPDRRCSTAAGTRRPCARRRRRRCSRSAGWTSRRCSPAASRPAFRLRRHLAQLLAERLAQPARPPRRLARRRRRPARRRADRRPRSTDLEDAPRARQPLRAAHGDVPRVRPARALGLPHLRALRPLPAGPDAARRGRAVGGLPPDDQRRGREGARPRRPPDPRRARRAGQGVRLRGPDRRPPSTVTAITRERALLLVVPRDLFARFFAGRGRGLARLPRRDPERPDGHAARDAAPGRPPRGEPRSGGSADLAGWRSAATPRGTSSAIARRSPDVRSSTLSTCHHSPRTARSTSTTT